MERQIRVDRIRIDPRLPGRTELRAIDDLARSIEAEGLRHAIVVRPSKKAGWFDIVQGSRRWRAVERLGWETVAAVVREDLAGDDDAASLAALAEDLTRQAPGRMQLAWDLARYRRITGAPMREIGSKFGMSAATARRYCNIGEAITTHALREAGVDADEAERMPTAALELIARAGGDREVIDCLAKAGVARREGRSVVAAVGGVDPSEEPWQFRSTPDGGLRLRVRPGVDDWSEDTARSLVKELSESALPLLRDVWTRAGETWIENGLRGEDLQRDRQEYYARGRRVGMQLGEKAGRELERKETEEERRALEQRIRGLVSRVQEEQQQATAIRMQVQDLEGRYDRERSELRLRYEMALAEQRQRGEAQRAEFIDEIVRLQRELGAAQRRVVELEAVPGQPQAKAGGGSLLSALFGAKQPA